MLVMFVGLEFRDGDYLVTKVGNRWVAGVVEGNWKRVLILACC